MSRTPNTRRIRSPGKGCSLPILGCSARRLTDSAPAVVHDPLRLRLELDLIGEALGCQPIDGQGVPPQLSRRLCERHARASQRAQQAQRAAQPRSSFHTPHATSYAAAESSPRTVPSTSPGRPPLRRIRRRELVTSREPHRTTTACVGRNRRHRPAVRSIGLPVRRRLGRDRDRPAVCAPWTRTRIARELDVFAGRQDVCHPGRPSNRLMKNLACCEFKMQKSKCKL